jgi:hypothetical protein
MRSIHPAHGRMIRNATITAAILGTEHHWTEAGPCMPLRCLDAAGQSIHSFDLSEETWSALAAKNRADRHLRMVCCPSQAILKRSSRGTRFFAHKAVGACTTAPETETHLRLKELAVVAARANGWEAIAEAVGSTPDGEPWRADVLATRGAHKVGIEIQWSRQTTEETLLRQERYRRSGIRCVWLLRHGDFPIVHELPAARIVEQSDRALAAAIPLRSGSPTQFTDDCDPSNQRLPVMDFLDAVFSRRFRFGLQTGMAATLSVLGGEIDCWHASCRARTRIVTFFEVAVGPNAYAFRLEDLERHRPLLDPILARLPTSLNIGRIKHRFSKTVGRSYLSNGCIRCDRIIGRFYEHEAWGDQEVMLRLPMTLSSQWKDVIESHPEYVATWAVYTAPPTDTG